MGYVKRARNSAQAILLSLTLGASAFGQVVWSKPSSAPAAQPPATPATQPDFSVSPQSDTPGLATKNVNYYRPIPGKKNKTEYVGPRNLVELAPTPMLDEEGRQRLDPDGKLMFNPPVRQQRDKRGNPLFDDGGNPVMQTSADMGYDEKGKKIHVKNVKQPKMISVSVQRGILTVDGMAGKAGLNYEIKDLKFIYLYAPWIGITIVSHAPFPGSIEEQNAFDDKTLTVTVDSHKLQLYSDRRLLGKKPEAAYVAVDRSFRLPAQFPVIGYGETLRPPYAWPGSRENAALKGPIAPPPLPVSLRPVTLLQPCPPGQMRMPGKTPLPGEDLPPQPCVLIQKALPGAGAPKLADAAPATTTAQKTVAIPAVVLPTTPAPAASADATPPAVAPSATPPNP
jgi:hypothetical protein